MKTNTSMNRNMPMNTNNIFVNKISRPILSRPIEIRRRMFVRVIFVNNLVSDLVHDLVKDFLPDQMSNMHMNTTMTMTTNKPLLRHIEYSDPTPNTKT